MKKEIKEVVKYALSHGFERLKTHNGHIVLRKNGRRVMVSGTPSVPEHSAKNAMKDIQNVLDSEH